jgi:ketosteroid isomerase-like protein
MTRKLILLSFLICAVSLAAFGQVKPPQPKAPETKAPRAPQTKAPEKTAPATEQTAPTGPEAVRAAFNKLLDGIRRANVKAVTDVYWNSPQLNLFNYNGTVTKGWEQMRKNRESSYPEIKDVKLEVRDVNVTMLGLNAALVTCVWTQSQSYKGAPETASGRMTLVFRKVGTAWKAIHLHSSPDQPNPAAIPPSEQVPTASPIPSPTPPPKQ